jgi:rod shape-determining protein MreC
MPVKQTLPGRARLFILSLVLLGVSLFLTAYSARHPSLGESGWVLVSQILWPLKRAYSFSADSLTAAIEGYVFLTEVEKENETLKKELGALRFENARLVEIEAENKRLKALLNVKEETKVEVVAANVIAWDPSYLSQILTINRGTRHGVNNGMTVLAVDGSIVGRVVRSGPRTSRVLLLLDAASGVDALIQRNRARGVLEGKGSDSVALRYVVKTDEVQKGDRVISSGLDGLYPPGFTLGEVVEVINETHAIFSDITVKPTADFRRLETVIVVLSFEDRD